MMNEAKQSTRNKGGRPKKAHCRDQQLAVMCTTNERKIIEQKAEITNTSISEFLRDLALKGHVDRRVKTLPKEILQLTGTINHLAANLNQIAKKRNGIEELNAFERAGLQVQSGELKKLAEQIKNYLR